MKTFTKTKRLARLQAGFTLIELLVVIAIIGILASVVLASLNSARAKGADAAVKGGMANMAAQIELWYDTNGNTYAESSGTATCTATSTLSTGTGAFHDGVVEQALTQISKNSGGSNPVRCYSGGGNGPTPSPGQFWAISTTLKSGGGWCVDNTGFRGVGTAQVDGTCSSGGTTGGGGPAGTSLPAGTTTSS